MMKTSKSTWSTIRSKKGGFKVGSEGKKKHSGKLKFDSNNEVDGNEIRDNEVGKNH